MPDWPLGWVPGTGFEVNWVAAEYLTLHSSVKVDPAEYTPDELRELTELPESVSMFGATTADVDCGKGSLLPPVEGLE